MPEWGESLRLLVQHFVRSLLPFYGFYPYRVGEQVGDQVTLDAYGNVTGLPAQLKIGKAHGLGGASEVLRPGASVLVGFQGGDPGQPFVAWYVDGAPERVRIDAQTTVTLGAEGSDPLAKGPATTLALSTLRTSLNVALAQLGKPLVPALGSVNTSKARGE